MKVKINSLKNKFAIYFSIFAISIFCILWLLQVILIKTNYRGMLIGEVEKIGQKIEKSDCDEETLDEIAYKNAMDVFVVSKTGEVIYLTDGMKQNGQGPNFIDIGIAINKAKASKEGHEIYTTTFSKFNLERLIYVSKTDLGYLVISTNVEPIGSVTRVLSVQLIYISIISILLSFGIAIILSKKIVKPITKIAEKAKELGKGNYDVVFEKSEYEEINELADSLNYSAVELKKTDMLRKELIANVSHDIRTPLTIIRSYAEMIKDISGDKKEKRDSHLTTIINQAELLTKLTEDMMDLSKLETKTYSLKLESFDILKSISLVIDGFKYLEEYEYVVNAPLGVNILMVKADKIKIEQVIYNLISNAVNYVGKDKAVYINVIDTQNIVKVEIKDNGKGIKEENLEHIFDRYYKSNDKQRKSGFGTGLGLSIIKNILDMHGFKYGIESKENVGTTVWFEINKI